ARQVRAGGISSCKWSTPRPHGRDSRGGQACVPRRSEHEVDDNRDGPRDRSRRRGCPLARSSESNAGTSRSAVPPLKLPRRRRGRISRRHRGRTPACVNPAALVTGYGENSTRRLLHDRLLRQGYYPDLTRPGRPLTPESETSHAGEVYEVLSADCAHRHLRIV